MLKNPQGMKLFFYDINKYLLNKGWERNKLLLQVLVCTTCSFI